MNEYYYHFATIFPAQRVLQKEKYSDWTAGLDKKKNKTKKTKKNFRMLSRDLFYKFQSFPKLPSCYKFKIILRLSATKICQIFNCFVCV